MNIQEQQKRLLQAGENLRKTEKSEAFYKGLFLGIALSSLLFFILLFFKF